MKKTITLEYKEKVNPLYSFYYSRKTTPKQTNEEQKQKRFCGTIPLSIGKCGEECEYYFRHNTKIFEIKGEVIEDYESQYHIIKPRTKIFQHNYYPPGYNSYIEMYKFVSDLNL